MPWNAEHKVRTRERILEVAAHLFTKNGFDAVSIDDVMREAELTRGAFYAHFSSKVDMYQEAIIAGARIARDRVGKNVRTLEELAEAYLRIGSQEGARSEYCPLAFLVTDICHQNSDVRDTYTRVLKGYQDILVGLGLTYDLAVQGSILLIGGLAMSRTTNDEELKQAILRNSLEGLKRLTSEER